uniref:Uncharacterized protein n=1 Tax=viral metagenome TaxID=1070528 RepID=A0A6C0IX19_9ZZZZ
MISSSNFKKREAEIKAALQELEQKAKTTPMPEKQHKLSGYEGLALMAALLGSLGPKK